MQGMGTMASKEVVDTEDFRQGNVCPMGKRWNFACRLSRKWCNHHAKFYIALLNKLKSQVSH
jgi:hypothetical protein